MDGAGGKTKRANAVNARPYAAMLLSVLMPFAPRAKTTRRAAAHRSEDPRTFRRRRRATRGMCARRCSVCESNSVTPSSSDATTVGFASARNTPQSRASRTCATTLSRSRDQHRKHRSRFGEIGIAGQFAQEEPRGRRMLAQIAAIPDEKMRKPAVRAGVAREPALASPRRAARTSASARPRRAPAYGEVMEHIGFADTGLARDVADRNAVEAALGKEPLGRAKMRSSAEGGRMGGRVVRHRMD